MHASVCGCHSEPIISAIRWSERRADDSVTQLSLFYWLNSHSGASYRRSVNPPTLPASSAYVHLYPKALNLPFDTRTISNAASRYSYTMNSGPAFTNMVESISVPHANHWLLKIQKIWSSRSHISQPILIKWTTTKAIANTDIDTNVKRILAFPHSQS